MARDADSEILKQIADCLRSYPGNITALGRVVSTLETLYSLITNRDEAWKDRFWGLWGSLEEVYAVALDRGNEALDGESRGIVSLAIDELRKMVVLPEGSSEKP